MDDNSSAFDTGSAPALSRQQSRQPLFKLSQYYLQTNLEIICTETRASTKRVLTIACEIYRTSLGRLNLVPDFSSQQRTPTR